MQKASCMHMHGCMQFGSSHAMQHDDGPYMQDCRDYRILHAADVFASICTGQQLLHAPGACAMRHHRLSCADGLPQGWMR